MSPHPLKRHCSETGCRAWAVHGQTRCAAHLGLRARTLRAVQWLALLRADADRLATLPLDEQRIIEAELRGLWTLRSYVLAWLGESQPPPEPGAEPGNAQAMNLTQFLRAWNDSVARIVQLLQARRQLASGQDGALDALLASALQQAEIAWPQ